MRDFFFTTFTDIYLWHICSPHKHCEWTPFAEQKTFSGAIACTLPDSPYVIELYFPMIGEKIKNIL